LSGPRLQGERWGVEEMFVVKVYAATRQFVFNDGRSRRRMTRDF